MSQIEKLLARFRLKPESLKYRDLTKVLLYLGCEKIEAKGSHVKFKHGELQQDIVIPVHNNECKAFYKKQTYSMLSTLLKKYEN